MDLTNLTSTTFYSGTRKLLGKQTIHSIIAHNNLLYAGGSAVDGAAGKVFSLLDNGATVGTFSTGLDIQQIGVNSDYIFTATKSGIIEVWLKEKVSKVASIKVAGSGKITSLMSDSDSILYAACSDGKIQVRINRFHKSVNFLHNLILLILT